jgi:DNA polymerase
VSAEPFLPEHPSLTSVRKAMQACEGCPLYRRATQAVPGVGRAGAALLLVGEQPGNDEDLAGKPFVGPAGKRLDRALEEAGIDRTTVFVTNAVKHFKWAPAEGKRLHKKPSAREVNACRPWLTAEIALVHPQVVVALGATAARSLFGNQVRVTRDRGEPLETSLAPHGMATIHPSSILRQRTDADRRREHAAFVEDLRIAAALLRQ